MPSTITDRPTIAPNQTAVGDAIKAAFIAIGCTSVDDYTASNVRQLVFSKNVGGVKIYSTCFFQISITAALSITETMYTAWNSTNKTGTNGGAVSSNQTFLTSANLEIKTFVSNQNEFNFLVVWQGNLSTVLGWLRPITLNNVDEDFTYPFLHFASLSGLSFRSCSSVASFLGSSTISAIFGNIATINSINKYDIVAKLPLFVSARNLMGITSDDIAYGCGNGLGLFATVGDWIKVWDGGSSSQSLYLK